MSEASYATKRKLRIIQEKVGPEWRAKYGDRSIDSIYNELIGDNRKNLFCKIDPTRKAQLDEMVEFYDQSMSEFIEQTIDREYSRYAQNKSTIVADLTKQFSG